MSRTGRNEVKSAPANDDKLQIEREIESEELAIKFGPLSITFPPLRLCGNRMVLLKNGSNSQVPRLKRLLDQGEAVGNGEAGWSRIKVTILDGNKPFFLKFI